MNSICGLILLVSTLHNTVLGAGLLVRAQRSIPLIAGVAICGLTVLVGPSPAIGGLTVLVGPSPVGVDDNLSELQCTATKRAEDDSPGAKCLPVGL